MTRGEIWTVAGGASYAGKPRPAVILQGDRFSTGESITVCPLTSDPSDLSFIRVAIEPDRGNGLRAVSRVMVDKISTVPKAKLGSHIGRLDDPDLERLNRAILVFLGLAP